MFGASLVELFEMFRASWADPDCNFSNYCVHCFAESPPSWLDLGASWAHLARIGKHFDTNPLQMSLHFWRIFGASLVMFVRF